VPDAIADLLAIGLCCPRCRGDLAPAVQNGEGSLRCHGCAHDYPVILGIPDLRIFADPYIDLDADLAKGRRLKAEGGRSWEDQVRFYYSITDSVTAAQAEQFAGGLRTAAARAEAVIASWQALDGATARTGRLLDVGCGTAPALAVSAHRAETLVGVDIAFRWLVVGQQRLADAGVKAHLVCACAEALPFRDGRFDLVEMQGTLENVRDQPLAVSEAARVMPQSGRLHVAAANRFSLGPDPHLGIPGGGWLPEGLAATVARRQGALPPQRRLLSLGLLAGLLRRGGFAPGRSGVPAVPSSTRRGHGMLLRAGVAAYEVMRALPLLRHLLLLVGPTLLVTTRKAGRAQP